MINNSVINWRVLFFAMLLCLYYIFPKMISVSLELLFFSYLFWGRKNQFVAKAKYRILPLCWYSIFAFTLVMTNIFSVDEETRNYLTTCVNCFIFIYICYLVIKDKKDVESFIIYFGYFGFVVCILLLPSILQTILTAGGRMGSTVHEGENSFLNDSISLGYILMMINTCQFYILVSSSSKKQKVIGLIFFLFSFFCILLTGTRKTLLACIICWTVYLYLRNKSARLKLLIYTLLGASILYFVYQISLEVEFLYNSIGMRLEGLIGFFNSDYHEVDASTEVRDELIKTGKQIFLNNPIFGAGINETQRILKIASHPHNNYISCLDFGGIVAFLAYYWFYIKIFARYFRIKSYCKLDIILLGMMLSLILTDYAATTYNIIFFPTFITIIYLNSLYVYLPISKINAKV